MRPGHSAGSDSSPYSLQLSRRHTSGWAGFGSCHAPKALSGPKAISEQFDANAPHHPPTLAAACWFKSHTYIQFYANRTLSYPKVNFWVGNVKEWTVKPRRRCGLISDSCATHKLIHSSLHVLSSVAAFVELPEWRRELFQKPRL